MANDWRQKRREEYAQKLKDPRWRAFRLQILDRDNRTCRRCGVKPDEIGLDVHHLYYEQGREPWDYPTEALVTLCEYCHDIETLKRPREIDTLLKGLAANRFFASDVAEIWCGIERALNAFPQEESRRLIAQVIARALADHDLLRRVKADMGYLDAPIQRRDTDCPPEEE